MDRHKMLPAVPAYEQSLTQEGTFSPETYIQLLEHENEQLRLRIQETITQMRALERKLAAEVKISTSLADNVKASKVEIKRRDETITSIAERIVQEFQRYTNSVQDVSEEEGYIPIGYSYFDPTS